MTDGQDSRTGAAVQEQSALLEELGGHTMRTLAIAPPSHARTRAYSANSLMFSMATDVWCDYRDAGDVIGNVELQLTRIVILKMSRF